MELRCVKNAIYIIFGNQIIWIQKYYTVQFILNKSMIETIIKDIRDLPHRVIQYHSKKIWVCSGHCCNLDGVLAVR